MHLVFILVLTIIYLSYATEPVIVEADKLERDKDGIIVATGNVKIVYQDKILQSEKVIYDTQNKKITLPTKMYIKTPSFEGTGSDGWWDIESDQGEVYNYEGLMDKQFYVRGTVLKKVRDEYNFKNLEFSTCPFSQRDWFVKSTSGYAKENDKLITYNTTLRFCKIPILYTPYFSYPLVERKSGFLPPIIGSDKYNTFIYKQPFFYVINDYSDITLTSDYRNRQGEGLSVEYRRSLDENSYLTGQIDLFKESGSREWWSGRTQTPLTYRWRLKLESNYSPFDRWKFYSKVDIPSDRYFFEDFYNMSFLRYTAFTRSYVVGRTDYGDFLTELNFDYFYDLTQPDNRKTLQRLPEVRIYKKTSNFFFENTYYDFLSDNNYFYREEGTSGIRTDNILNIYRYDYFGKFTNIAQFQPRFTAYINTKNGNTLDTRFLIPFKESIQTSFIKGYDGFIHSFIPKLTFEYISKLNQSNLPYYDREDRVDEKKDLDVYLYNILNFRKDYYFRWEVSSGYTFLGSYKIGENQYYSDIKPLKNSLLFAFKRITADTITYYDTEKGRVIRTVTSLGFTPKNWLSYSISYSFDSYTANSKQLSNSFNINLENYKLSGYILSNLSGGYVQRKLFSFVWDRKCWNITFNFYEDYNKTTEKRYRNIFVIVNIMGFGYKLPFIRN
ncbi:MAG: LPS assembly protein LptD [Hydrogenothermaceae bacterium]|nr:LPS assembly protein LptD [Hydrogenothermaceae bacterium]